MAFITSPTSFRLAQAARGIYDNAATLDFSTSSLAMVNQSTLPFTAWLAVAGKGHYLHPNFAHLTLLVFEAVLEVVCVSLPGYILARMGMFDMESQKFVANLNVALFTPCLSTCYLCWVTQIGGMPLLHLDDNGC